MSRLSEMSDQEFNQLGRIGKQATSPAALFINYNKEKGGYYMMGAEITGSEWIAAPDACLLVWKLFKKNKNTGKSECLDFLKMFASDSKAYGKNGKPRRPETHADKSAWEIDEKDPKRVRRNDPWGWSFELPCIHPESGAVAVYSASTALTKPAVGRLLEDLKVSERRPVVTLAVEPDPDNINRMVPVFRITDHCDDDGDLPGFTGDDIAPADDALNSATPEPNGARPAPNGPTSDSGPTGAPTKPKAGSDMDDDIPF
jgi:hypothetical protein